MLYCTIHETFMLALADDPHGRSRFRDRKGFPEIGRCLSGAGALKAGSGDHPLSSVLAPSNLMHKVQTPNWPINPRRGVQQQGARDHCGRGGEATRPSPPGSPSTLPGNPKPGRRPERVD